MNSDFEKITGEKILQKSSLGGGCIGNSNKITTESGSTFFVKSYQKTGVARAEALGLEELEKAHAISVPHVIGFTEHTLVLKHITSNSKSPNFQIELGKRFANLHKYNGDRFGFKEDNFIGDTHQINSYRDKWTDFYTANRLDYQIELAHKNGFADSQLKSCYKKLRNLIPEILSGSEEQPSLLHGDLWGGNVMSDENGDPCIIDPAVYYGHREADLAMTKVFGGFTSEFYQSYNNTYPLKNGYLYRENIYKLYHILNHLNLFGRSYYEQAISLMNSYLQVTQKKSRTQIATLENIVYIKLPGNIHIFGGANVL